MMVTQKKENTVDTIKTLLDASFPEEVLAGLDQLQARPPTDSEQVRCNALILRQFTSWMESESERPWGPSEEARQHIRFLRSILDGELTIDPEDALHERTEDVECLADAIGELGKVVTELMPDATETHWWDFRGAVALTPYQNPALLRLAALLLTARLLREAADDGVPLPLGLDAALRFYMASELPGRFSRTFWPWVRGEVFAPTSTR